MHALSELRKGDAAANEKHEDSSAEPRRIRNQKVKLKHDKSERKVKKETEKENSLSHGGREVG